MQKTINWLLNIVILVSVVFSINILSQRMTAEHNFTNIQVAVRYQDILHIIEYTDYELDEVLDIFLELGVNNITVEENVLLPEYYSVSNAKDFVTSDLARGYIDIVKEEEYRLVIEAIDEVTLDRIYDNLVTKGVTVTRDGDYLNIFSQRPYKNLTQLGTGFDIEALTYLANRGFEISPEIRGFTSYSEYGIQTLIDQLEQIPNLGHLLFDGTRIPAYTEANMIKFAREYGFAYMEFFSDTQEGYITLSRRIEQDGVYNVIRMFSPDKLSHIKASGILDTLELALVERNVRAFGFVLPNTGGVEKDFETLQDEISGFVESALGFGYTLDTDIEMKGWPVASRKQLLVIGLGAVAMFMKIIAMTQFAIIGYLAGIGGTLYYVALLLSSKIDAMQSMAFVTTVVFSSYGVLLCIDPPKKKSLTLALMHYCKITLVTFMGIAIMAALISEYSFAIGVNLYKGVKASHVLPLIIVAGMIIVTRWKEIVEEVKKLLKINWKYLVGFGILGVFVVYTVVTIYVSRTGNTTQIPELEALLRATLDDTLGIRPRTKEFMIGHPFMILGLYMSYKGFRWPVLVVGTIGQLSMINTFAHIHTPLIVSGIRTGYGIAMGVIIGIGFIIVYEVVTKIISKVISRWNIKLT
ncbi:MAG: hypothetical protein ATN35_06530 [Epulopiscium sp. Nele67-Bin004]|nr:MAG: hypothetical protein ATN35_06530 [Epulopiscium sp. Nele67-Bin004]